MFLSYSHYKYFFCNSHKVFYLNKDSQFLMNIDYRSDSYKFLLLACLLPSFLRQGLTT